MAFCGKNQNKFLEERKKFFLSKKINRSLFENVQSSTKLTTKEIKALYERFRKIAPHGRMDFAKFRETLGIMGTIDQTFLSSRLFCAFDLNNDHYLDFSEYAIALGIMIRGTDDEKLDLSFKILHSPPAAEDASIRTMDSQSVCSSDAEKEDEEDILSVASERCNYNASNTNNMYNKMHKKEKTRTKQMLSEECISLEEFVDVVKSIDATRRALVGSSNGINPLPSDEEIERIFYSLASAGAHNSYKIFIEDFKYAVRHSAEFLILLGVIPSQYTADSSAQMAAFSQSSSRKYFNFKGNSRSTNFAVGHNPLSASSSLVNDRERERERVKHMREGGVAVVPAATCENKLIKIRDGLKDIQSELHTAVVNLDDAIARNASAVVSTGNPSKSHRGNVALYETSDMLRIQSFGVLSDANFGHLSPPPGKEEKNDNNSNNNNNNNIHCPTNNNTNDNSNVKGMPYECLCWKRIVYPSTTNSKSLVEISNSNSAVYDSENYMNDTYSAQQCNKNINKNANNNNNSSTSNYGIHSIKSTKFGSYGSSKNVVGGNNMGEGGRYMAYDAFCTPKTVTDGVHTRTPNKEEEENNSSDTTAQQNLKKKLNFVSSASLNTSPSPFSSSGSSKTAGAFSSSSSSSAASEKESAANFYVSASSAAVINNSTCMHSSSPSASPTPLSPPLSPVLSPVPHKGGEPGGENILDNSSSNNVKNNVLYACKLHNKTEISSSSCLSNKECTQPPVPSSQLPPPPPSILTKEKKRHSETKKVLKIKNEYRYTEEGESVQGGVGEEKEASPRLDTAYVKNVERRLSNLIQFIDDEAALFHLHPKQVDRSTDPASLAAADAAAASSSTASSSSTSNPRSSPPGALGGGRGASGVYGNVYEMSRNPSASPLQKVKLSRQFSGYTLQQRLGRAKSEIRRSLSPYGDAGTDDAILSSPGYRAGALYPAGGGHKSGSYIYRGGGGGGPDRLTYMYMNRPNFEDRRKERLRRNTLMPSTMRTLIKKPQKEFKLLGPSKGLAVHFGHESWDMVLNMMIGIRLAAVRANREPKRKLENYDFIIKEKFSIIPRSGNILLDNHLSGGGGGIKGSVVSGSAPGRKDTCGSILEKDGGGGGGGKDNTGHSSNQRRVHTRGVATPRAALGASNNNAYSHVHTGGAEGPAQSSVNSNKVKLNSVRFVDYAPLVFRKLREFFGISAEDYYKSVGPEQLLGNMVLGNLSSLSELVSEGKSGAFFYYTADGKFMIKTVSKETGNFMRGWLRDYYLHCMKYPNTFLTRFYGFHAIRFKQNNKFKYNRLLTSNITTKVKSSNHGLKLYFVVMGNVFHTPVEIHRRYDLKGSWVGRSLEPHKRNDPTIALKDLDMDRMGDKIEVGDSRGNLLKRQMKHDCDFLKSHLILDYSLLLGIHYRQKSDELDLLEEEYRENERYARRRNKTEEDTFDKKYGSNENDSNNDNSSNVQNINSSNRPDDMPLNIFHNDSGITMLQTDSNENDESHYFSPDHMPKDVPVHQRDFGGMLSTDNNKLYYLGIIDVSTRWTAKKKVENALRTIQTGDPHGVSCVHPHYYATRFLDFIYKRIV